MKGPEPIFDHLKAILANDLSAYLNLLDLEYADWALPDIQAVYIEDSESSVVTYPAIYLQQNADPEMNKASGSAAVTYLVDVIVCDECALLGLEHLTRNLWRYARAIAELLRLHQYQIGYWDNLQVVQFLISPTLPGALDATYWRGAGVRVGCQVMETY